MPMEKEMEEAKERHKVRERETTPRSIIICPFKIEVWHVYPPLSSTQVCLSLQELGNRASRQKYNQLAEENAYGVSE